MRTAPAPAAATAFKAAALATVLVLAATGSAYAVTDDRPATHSPVDDVRIDRNAPVITRTEILIHAPLATVWKIQTDVEKWPTWQPSVEAVTKDTPGRLRPGSVFRWSTEGLDIVSTVRQADHGRRLAWGGPAQGITAIHVWTFTPTRDGVLVRTEESWTGAPVLAHQAALQAALDQSLHHWVTNLKHRAETGPAE
ncbi:SRPBCC family protein [Streptomyces sp. NPDC006430]|uniref:SRPBCC family protein n=1 Tax=Streptomyces sp. NPDC006430 TaxID=3154299 RepID=UPI0033A622B2